MDNMYRRISIVHNIQVYTTALSAIVQIGDNSHIKSRANIFAVQRQIPYFLGNEGDLSQFPIFKRSIPQPPLPRGVALTTDNKSSHIKVNSIRIIGLSASAVFQVGSNHRMDLESRTKHIRQFIEKA